MTAMPKPDDFVSPYLLQRRRSLAEVQARGYLATLDRKIAEATQRSDWSKVEALQIERAMVEASHAQD